jgi:hypothetical protein
MATEKSSAPAHPSTEEHDDTVEAHYASLERAHVCNDGWVSIGCLDDEGEEHQVLFLCRRCEASPEREGRQ